MFSRPLLGTNINKVKMSWIEYIFTHLIPTAFQTFHNNFILWRDLITENYEPYKLLKDDDPFQECYDWFFTSINLDETYPKEFLEYLMQMAHDVETGKVETIPADEVFKELEKLFDDLKTDEELEDED